MPCVFRRYSQITKMKVVERTNFLLLRSKSLQSAIVLDGVNYVIALRYPTPACASAWGRRLECGSWIFCGISEVTGRHTNLETHYD